MAILLS